MVTDHVDCKRTNKQWLDSVGYKEFSVASTRKVPGAHAGTLGTRNNDYYMLRIST